VLLDDQRAQVVVTLKYKVVGRCTNPSLACDGEMGNALEWWDVNVP
jgi:hypothetical protein